MTSKTKLSALTISVVGYAFDGFDTLLISFLLPSISVSLALSHVEGASLATLTLVGAMIGGIYFGSLSDRIGRVRVLTWTILIFAVTTGLCSIAQSFNQLLALRVIAGIGLGGEFGIGMALVAEAWPANQRATASSYVALGWQTGVLIAALVVPQLIPLIGWRGAFLLGAIPSIAAFGWRAKSHDFDFARIEDGDPTAPSASVFRLWPILFSDRSAAMRSLAVAALCSIQNFGYYGVMIWLPTYLAENFHLAALKSSVWTSVTVLGMFAGIITFGHLADRIGRRNTFLFFQGGAAISVLWYSTLRSPDALLLGGAVMGAFVNGMVGGYGALISDFYPSKVRATAQNALFNCGRLIGSLGPIFVAQAAKALGFSGAIGLLSLIYVVAAGITIQSIPPKIPLPKLAS